MKVETSSRGDVAVLHLAGKLTLGEGEQTLRACLAPLLEGGVKRVVVDLADVPTIDSSGLGELVACRATCSRFDAEIRLLRPSVKILQLMMVSKLNILFEIFEDESVAVDSASSACG